MKIIHFSDPHAGGSAEDWMAYIDKRFVGVFNYKFRRRFKHDLSLLDKAVDYILDVKPDIAVCTGDLTSTGQPGEFKKSLDILARLRDSQIPMVYVIGNHDFYVYRKTCVQAMKDAFKYMNTAFNLEFDDLPVKREFNGINFFVVNESWPSNLISSHGLMKKDTRDFLMKECQNHPNPHPRIIVGHYPLIEEYPILRMRHRLFGEKEALKLLNEKKIDLSLCGHMHVPYAKIDENGRGEICAGSITRNKCLAEIDYDSNDNKFYYQKVVLD